MKAIFVNHCHPEKQHVCATRIWHFACAMAVRGHKIILLTESLNPNHSHISLTDLFKSIKVHDWSEPFVIPVVPVYDKTLTKLRNGELWYGLRQITILYRYLKEGGVFGNWRRGASAYFKFLEEMFDPDVIWSSFGNTDCWNIAQDLSWRLRCPWVGDLKDNWNNFLPSGLSTLVAKRYCDMREVTAFSQTHRTQIQRVFKKDSTVIYSGFPKTQVKCMPLSFFNRILITGSLYNFNKVKILIDGILQWIQIGAKRAQNLEVNYVGGDVELFHQATKALTPLCKTVCNRYLSIENLMDLQATAWVNAYIYNEKSLFQHKTLELLAASRPVISVPGESAEFLSIVQSVGAKVQICSSPQSVFLALENFNLNDSSKLDPEKMSEFSWESQVVKLEETLQSASTNK